jgi:LCP family protein required for cell wall assembly
VSPPPRPAGRRSAFAAAFLSLLFPGLGQAYGGAPRRGVVVAAPAVLLVAFAAGVLIDPGTRRSFLFALLDTSVLVAVLLLDIVLLAYRLWAMVDAYRVTATHNSIAAAEGARRRPRLRLAPVSVAGLLAVLLVGSGAHAAVAYYDLTAYDVIRTITGGAGNPTASPEPSPTSSPGASASPSTGPTNAGRLNILLVGVDRRPGDETFNTDTMIVMSIDPASKQIAMLSLPRDVVDVPLPKAWPAYSYYGGSYPAKINSLWSRAQSQAALFPFPTASRGPDALKGVLGTLYGLDIPYYVEVDFDGFRRVVDTFGGVTIPVEQPVQDDHYPQEFGRGATRLYIPATIQHMTGDQALAFARSRHGSNDFDRAARQQQVILALRQQADIPTILGQLPTLVDALKTAVHTDIPTSMLPQLASTAEQVGFDNVRSLVFSPPLYGQERINDPRGYVIIPSISAIRRAVTNAFTFDPALEKSREAIAAEASTVRVLNGSGTPGQAKQIADYLTFRGFGASVPTANGGRADKSTYTTTVITAYNGAEANFPQSAALLEKLFGVQVVVKTDAKVTVDFVVITGSLTPKLVAPP